MTLHPPSLANISVRGVLFLAVLLSCATVAPAANGPPNAFGYVWADSASGCDPTLPGFGLGAMSLLGITAAEGPFDLGFVMPFYGEPVSQV